MSKAKPEFKRGDVVQFTDDEDPYTVVAAIYRPEKGMYTYVIAHDYGAGVALLDHLIDEDSIVIYKISPLDLPEVIL